MYFVNCALCTVNCTLYTVHCTMYTVHCSVRYTLYTVCTLYTVHCKPTSTCHLVEKLPPHFGLKHIFTRPSTQSGTSQLTKSEGCMSFLNTFLPKPRIVESAMTPNIEKQKGFFLLKKNIFFEIFGNVDHFCNGVNFWGFQLICFSSFVDFFSSYFYFYFLLL